MKIFAKSVFMAMGLVYALAAMDGLTIEDKEFLQQKAQASFLANMNDGKKTCSITYKIENNHVCFSVVTRFYVENKGISSKQKKRSKSQTTLLTQPSEDSFVHKPSPYSPQKALFLLNEIKLNLEKSVPNYPGYLSSIENLIQEIGDL